MATVRDRAATVDPADHTRTETILSDHSIAKAVESSTDESGESDGQDDLDRLDSRMVAGDNLSDMDDSMAESLNNNATTDHGSDLGDIMAAQTHAIIKKHEKKHNSMTEIIQEAQDAADLIVFKWEKLVRNGVEQQNIFFEAAVQAVSLPYDNMQDFVASSLDNVRKEIGQVASHAVEQSTWTQTVNTDGGRQLIFSQLNMQKSLAGIKDGMLSAIDAQRAVWEDKLAAADVLLRLSNTAIDVPNTRKRKVVTENSSTKPAAKRARHTETEGSSCSLPVARPVSANLTTLNKASVKSSKTPRKTRVKQQGRSEKWNVKEEIFLLKCRADEDEWFRKPESGKLTISRTEKHAAWLKAEGYEFKDIKGNTIPPFRSWNAMEQHLNKLDLAGMDIAKLEMQLKDDGDAAKTCPSVKKTTLKARQPSTKKTTTAVESIEEESSGLMDADAEEEMTSEEDTNASEEDTNAGGAEIMEAPMEGEEMLEVEAMVAVEDSGEAAA